MNETKQWRCGCCGEIRTASEEPNDGFRNCSATGYRTTHRWNPIPTAPPAAPTDLLTAEEREKVEAYRAFVMVPEGAATLAALDRVAPRQPHPAHQLREVRDPDNHNGLMYRWNNGRLESKGDAEPTWCQSCSVFSPTRFALWKDLEARPFECEGDAGRILRLAQSVIDAHRKIQSQ